MEEALARCYQLAEKDCDGAVSEVHLLEISRSCCKKWRLLPAHLEMREVVVDDIDHINGDEQEKRCYSQEMEGSQRFWCYLQKKLINALLAIECRQDADKMQSVCELLQKSPAPVLASESVASGKQ